MDQEDYARASLVLNLGYEPQARIFQYAPSDDWL
jgi:hypothetical protein